jgi:hypothetical protein
LVSAGLAGFGETANGGGGGEEGGEAGAEGFVVVGCGGVRSVLGIGVLAD